MFSSKSALLAQSLLFFASYASCQGDATPNGTLYIPGIAQLAGVVGTPVAAIVASQVSVDGVSTVFEIVDALPTAVNSAPLTATLVISPTGAHLTSDSVAAGISDVDINCAIAGSEASCQLEAQAGGLAVSTSFTEATSGVPVVAVGFASTSAAAASGSASGSSATGSASGSGSSSGSTISVSVTVAPSSSVSTPTSGSTSNSVSPASASSGSSTPSSASSTAPASSASPSPTQPSSATNVHVSMGSVLFGLVVVVAFSLATL